MGRHLRSGDGRFAGSVPDGKTRTPTPADSATTVLDAPDGTPVDAAAGYLAMRDRMLAAQPGAVEEDRWHAPYLGRPCTICGDTLNYVGAHKAADCDQRAIRHDDATRADLRARLVARLTDGTDDETSTGWLPVVTDGEPAAAFDPGIRAIPVGRSRALSDEEAMDVWATAGPQERAAIVGAHIADHPGGRFAPSRLLRAAVIEYPAGGQAQVLLARMDPPLTDAEKTRMLARTGSDTRVARALLADPGSRDFMHRWLTTTPTRAGIFLAHTGAIPASTLSVMAASPDRMVRGCAASAPNTPVSDLARLAVDSDFDVRRSVAQRDPGTLPVAVVATLVADEHPDIAFSAFMHHAEESGHPTDTGYRMTRTLTPVMLDLYDRATPERQAQLRERLRHAPFVDLEGDPLLARLLA